MSGSHTRRTARTSVSTYLAKDPEGSGVTYSLVTADDVDDTMLMLIADNDLFSISSIGGILSFKASPNYEEPKDGLAANEQCATPPVGVTCDNTYHVTVQATVADNKNPRDTITGQSRSQ